MDRRVAAVTLSIEKHGDFVGVVEGSVAETPVSGRTSARTLPEDVIKSLLQRAEKILRQAAQGERDMRNERHNGCVGDAFLVRELPMPARYGTNTFVLNIDDVLVRTSHGGDCFSYFCVWRAGVRVGTWWGYDSDISVITTVLGNVVDDASELPYKQRGIE